jgi:hypothetical protein
MLHLSSDAHTALERTAVIKTDYRETTYQVHTRHFTLTCNSCVNTATGSTPNETRLHRTHVAAAAAIHSAAGESGRPAFFTKDRHWTSSSAS